MPRLLALLIAAIALCGGLHEAARAQATNAGSFLNPFPENDHYRVQVFGDNMGEGLREGLAEVIVNDPRLALEKKNRWLGGVLKADIDEEIKAIGASLKPGQPHIAVILTGAEDRISARQTSGRRAGIGSQEWKDEYARRLDVIMRAMRQHGVGVFWVGLPVMRRSDANDDAQMINELIRSRALANGVRYIDIFASFADADKSYDSHGPDIAGKNRLLRDSDGVHFTAAGYQKLAYFVERELKRAAAQAWDERTIPLAGSETEQARIRPPTMVKLAAVTPASKKTAAGAPAPSGASVQAGASVQSGAGGIAADNSRITLRSQNAQGREESTAIEIVRPAIPAAVVAMVTRRESADKASQVGEAVMTEILGGLTVVSSVSSLAEATADRRKGGGDASTPLHRVLQLGETPTPKPGRADEMPWPRPEPVLERRAVLTGAEVEPAAQPKLMPAGNDGVPLPRRPSRDFRRK